VRSLLIFLLIVLVALAGGYFFIKNKLGINPQVAVSLLNPPQTEVIKLGPQGEDLPFPLTVPEGYHIGVFARLEGALPRALAIDPAGVLFASVPARGRILAFPDKDKDGIADSVKTILSGLNSPHGITFLEDNLYVAETDRVVKYEYDQESYLTGRQETLFTLPGGGRHFSRTIRIIGGKLYTSVGSSCDTCREGDEKRAALLVSDLDGKNLRVFAKGLRNTVFFTQGEGGAIWGTDMGRDFLGDSLPPEDINIIEDGKDYGWPFCYGDKIRDSKFEPGQNLDYCSGTTPPVFSLPAHVAPLGLTFMEGDLLVSLHGSWNSSTPVGYKVVRLNVEGRNVSNMEDFITGFINGSSVSGRPVDLIVDGDGRLFVSDDKAGLIYVVTKAE